MVALATMTYYLMAFAAYFIVFLARWMVFEKAGQPGWKVLIPVYNSYIITKICFGNGWLFLLLLIPFVNVVFACVLNYKLAQAFGKGIGFTLGLIFLNPIFYIILGWGDARYLGVQR